MLFTRIFLNSTILTAFLFSISFVLTGCAPDTIVVECDPNISVVNNEIKELNETTIGLNSEINKFSGEIRFLGDTIKNKEIINILCKNPSKEGKKPPGNWLKRFFDSSGFNIAVLVSLIGIIVSLRSLTIRSTSYSLINIMSQKNMDIINEVYPNLNETGKNKTELKKDIMGVLSYLNMISKLFMHSAINLSILRTFEPNIIHIFEHEHVKKVYRELVHSMYHDGIIAEPPHVNLLFAHKILLRINPMINYKRNNNNIFARGVSVILFFIANIYAHWLRFKYKHLTSQWKMWGISKAVVRMHESEPNVETDDNS